MSSQARLAVFVFFFFWMSGYHPAATMNRSNLDLGKTNRSQLFSEWTLWSRCVDCVQRRLKTCISPKCHDSSMYEERPCSKKRCKRKLRHKSNFHVIQQGQDSGHLMRHAPSRVWSKWTNWSPCSANCRTKRVRKCRKPGRCRKKIQEQSAYCYYENSLCESHIIHLLNQQQGPAAATTARPPKKRKKKCGVAFRKSRMLKIIGGVESKKNRWPWHVAILNKYDEVFCGGTLISPRWVLTACHCVRPHLRVKLNEYDLRADDGRELELAIHKIFQHPSFNQQTVDNDIALLQLPIVVNLPVACLPNRAPRPKEMCSVMGWGKLNTEDTYGTHMLHETQLPVVEKEVCRRSYRQFSISPNMLCAGWMSGKSDTCAGDSGGGLMCPQALDKPRLSYSVQGITSFGDGCGLRNKYGIYTTVYNYLNWIHLIMNHY